MEALSNQNHFRTEKVWLRKPNRLQIWLPMGFRSMAFWLVAILAVDQGLRLLDDWYSWRAWILPGLVMLGLKYWLVHSDRPLLEINDQTLRFRHTYEGQFTVIDLRQGVRLAWEPGEQIGFQLANGQVEKWNIFNLTREARTQIADLLKRRLGQPAP